MDPLPMTSSIYKYFYAQIYEKPNILNICEWCICVDRRKVLLSQPRNYISKNLYLSLMCNVYIKPIYTQIYVLFI